MIFTLIIVYLINMLVCCMIHAYRATRTSDDLTDFLILTFLPYVVYKLLKGEEL